MLMKLPRKFKGKYIINPVDRQLMIGHHCNFLTAYDLFYKSQIAKDVSYANTEKNISTNKERARQTNLEKLYQSDKQITRQKDGKKRKVKESLKYKKPKLKRKTVISKRCAEN